MAEKPCKEIERQAGEGSLSELLGLAEQHRSARLQGPSSSRSLWTGREV
jgi:hypothetical protein